MRRARYTDNGEPCCAKICGGSDLVGDETGHWGEIELVVWRISLCTGGCGHGTCEHGVCVCDSTLSAEVSEEYPSLLSGQRRGERCELPPCCSTDPCYSLCSSDPPDDADLWKRSPDEACYGCGITGGPNTCGGCTGCAYGNDATPLGVGCDCDVSC